MSSRILPVPKPRMLRYTPLSRFSPMKAARSSVLLMPTLKSPSVARDHPVVAVFPEVFSRQGIGGLDAVRPGGGPRGGQVVDGVEDRGFIGAAGAVQHDRGAAGVGDDGDPVIFGEGFHEQAERGFQERQLVVGIHGTRGVDQEGEVAGGQAALIDLRGFHPDKRHLPVGMQRGGADFGVDGEGSAVVGSSGSS